MDPKDMGFVSPTKLGEDEKPEDVFTQLLEGTEDDERAVEPTDDDLGTLEEEWQRLKAADEAHEQAKRHEKVTKAALTAQKERLKDAMERQGTRQFRGSDGGLASVATTYTTALDNEDAFMEWCHETHPELLSVHSQRRTKFIREEYRDRGVPVEDPSFPPGLRVGTIETLQVRGARPPTEKQGD